MTDSNNINITGLSKPEILKALFNGSFQQGMGVLDQSGAVPMTLEAATQIIDERGEDGLYFDYVRGRVIKVSLSSETELRPSLYDRDNGEGAAARAIETLRKEATPP